MVMRQKNNKILILGGNGFIGKNLSEFLSQRNFEVFSFDIKDPENKLDDVVYIKGDFFDDKSLYEALENKDYIVHALTTITPANSSKYFYQAYSKDFIQSLKVFDYARKNNINLLFLSSGGTIYGDQNEYPIKETAVPNPINHYGNVKLCMENIINLMNKEQGCNLKIARISNPYGPGHSLQKGVGFVDTAIKNSIWNKPIEIWGDGSTVRDYIYIKDVCSMLHDIMTQNSINNVFNVSTGIGTSQTEIVKLIEALGYKTRVSFKDRRKIDVPTNILDNTRIKEISNCCLTSIKEGMSLYNNYLRSHL